MEVSNIDADSNDSCFTHSEKIDDKKASTQTPLIDSILGGMHSGVEATPANFSELVLRQVREQFNGVPFDHKICATVVSSLLCRQFANRLSATELQSVSKSVANAMMAHAPTRSRIEKLWQSLSGTQK